MIEAETTIASFTPNSTPDVLPAKKANRDKALPLSLVVLAPPLAFCGAFIVGHLSHPFQQKYSENQNLPTASIPLEQTKNKDSDIDLQIVQDNLNSAISDMKKNQNWKVNYAADQFLLSNAVPTLSEEYAGVFIDDKTQQITLGYSIRRFGDKSFDLIKAEESLTTAVLVHSMAIRDPVGFKDPGVQSIYWQTALKVLPYYFPKDTY